MLLVTFLFPTSIKMYILITLLLVASCHCSKLPEWVELDCSPGHQYLFSNQLLSVSDASDACNLYGGYLLAIDSLREQNCLLKYGKTANLDHWYWFQGIIQ